MRGASSRGRGPGATAGAAILLVVAAAAAAAPILAPHDYAQQFRDQLYAPPMTIHVVDERGRWHTPFVYRWRLVDPLERRYVEDRRAPVPIEWLSGGRLFRGRDGAPLLLLGADSFGRDLLARWLWGARTSLAIAALATVGALALGAIIGGLAGLASGSAPTVDEGLMRLTELVLVLPLTYVVLALRAVMPLVLSPPTIFLILVSIMALAGWPHVARGVRAIIVAAAHEDYVLAARSVGAGRARLLIRHLLPSTTGFLRGQAVVFLPAFVIAEATLSYVGFGFPDTVPTWGTMLQEVANVTTIARFPWLLAPAAGIVLVALGANLMLETRD